MNSVSMPSRPRSRASRAAAAISSELASDNGITVEPTLPSDRGRTDGRAKPTLLVGYGDDLLLQGRVRSTADGRARSPVARAPPQPEGDRRRRGPTAGLPRAGGRPPAQGGAGDERPRR